MQRAEKILAQIGATAAVSGPPLKHVEFSVAQRVAVIELIDERSLNALHTGIAAELGKVFDLLEARDDVACIVIRGRGRAFAAGADIKQMATMKMSDLVQRDAFEGWDRVSRVRLPLIAQVHGFALGGGCELAMMCDIVIAAESTKFGQPEINLGTLPGLGGTQRFTRAVGKAKSMLYVLTGQLMSAKEAERLGLVSEVVPDADLEKRTMMIARTIASKSKPAVALAKAAVNAADETTLTQGIAQERRLFHTSFGLEDRKEGMLAFVEKRKPRFENC